MENNFKYLTGSHFILNLLLKKHCIKIISHSHMTGNQVPFKTINWIPDFQHMHYPDMFTNKEIEARNKQFEQYIKFSDRIIVSSDDAAKDLSDFMPGYERKVNVLKFASQPPPDIFDDDRVAFEEIRKKYKFRGKFFYLPNQFWRHKNHKVVFEAVNILKTEGLDILVLCSGYHDDYRHKEYLTELKEYISINNLEENILLLGLIDYKDVFILMRYSLAIINPSFFEGWSSTVEEAKSIGKNIILSAIDVHKEQNPPHGEFFDPSNSEQLASILKRYWTSKEEGLDTHSEKKALELLPERTRRFGESYQKIVQELFTQ